MFQMMPNLNWAGSYFLRSNTELVVPLRHNGRVIGVIDLDSPIPARFDADDQAGIEVLAEIFVVANY